MKTDTNIFFTMILIFFITNIISSSDDDTIVNEIRCVKDKLHEINEILTNKCINLQNRKYFNAIDRQKSINRIYCTPTSFKTDKLFTSVASIQKINELSYIVTDLKEYLKTNTYKNFDSKNSDIFNKKMLDLFNSLLEIVLSIDCMNKVFNLKKEELNTYVSYLIDKYKISLNLDCCSLLLEIYFFMISRFLIQIEILIDLLKKNK